MIHPKVAEVMERVRRRSAETRARYLLAGCGGASDLLALRRVACGRRFIWNRK